MKAAVVHKGGAPEVLQFETVPTPSAAPGQALVRLKAAALNHRDLNQRLSYAGSVPMILGSDGAGVVEAVGSGGAGPGTDAAWVGKPVVINPALHWGDREDAPSSKFQILGNPTPGTYAEYIVVPAENLAPKPEHLSFQQAAALPLAGLTAWRGLFTRGQLRPGQTVLLPGIGSGVAVLALAFAKLAGARVIVTSSSEEKLQAAKQAGADAGVNYTQPDWEGHVRAAAGEGGIDLVLDHSGATTIPADVRLVRPGGRVVFLGATTGADVKLNLREVFFRQVQLIGTTMGSPREFAELFRFIALHRYTPEVRHVYPLAQAAQAHALMDQGKQYGKIVLEVG
jgi:NADPH:quinone reductase-like Zn-dependent oxidoreductase